MRHLVDHAHEPGRHCASTSVADLMRFYGVPWGEAMCFGIGGGLGLWYLQIPGVSPSRMLHSRSIDFERRFFERIGMEFEWRRDEDPTVAESNLKAALAAGRPALLLTDIFHLPYYRSQTHFPSHCIIAWGFDDDQRVFYVSDTEREGVLAVPFENMRQARVSLQMPVHHGDFFAPATVCAPARLDGIFAEAIVDNARQLLGSDLPSGGIDALGIFEADLPKWKTVDDWQWAARFMYQTIEKRGTGGGAFRLMYAEFLAQAARAVPRVAELELPALMLQSGRAWQALAEALKVVSEQPAPETTAVEAALNHVIVCERRYATRAVQLEL